MSNMSMVMLEVNDVARTTVSYEACGWRRSSTSVPGVVSFLHGSTAALGLFGRDAPAADAGSFQDLDGRLWDVAHNPFSPLRDDRGLSLPDARATGS